MSAAVVNQDVLQICALVTVTEWGAQTCVSALVARTMWKTMSNQPGKMKEIQRTIMMIETNQKLSTSKSDSLISNRAMSEKKSAISDITT